MIYKDGKPVKRAAPKIVEPTPATVAALPPEYFEEALRHAEAQPRKFSKEQQDAELLKCKADILYFANTYAHIFDKVSKSWIRLALWPAQEEAILTALHEKFLIVLKARQEGMTWCLGGVVPLWEMLFDPIAKILMFSQRDDEAKDLIERLKGMYNRLPKWMQLPIASSNDHEFALSNESGALALTSSSGGRSYPATRVHMDEADFMPDFAATLKAAQPTIDDGPGKMVVLSTVNDDTPGSPFQNMFKEALKGLTDWKALFFPWSAHPGRTQQWYDRKVATAMTLFGSLDSVHKEYPASPEQALAARSSNKRFSPLWIRHFSYECAPIPFSTAPALPSLSVYREVQDDHAYAIGVDPAEGMQSSDDSVITVVDKETREEVAVLSGKVEPSTLADYTAALSEYYNSAVVLYERNNHGILFGDRMRKAHLSVILKAGEDTKPGWHTSYPSKVKLYTHAVELMQNFIRIATDEAERELDPSLLPKIIHNSKTILQLESIESGDANRAPAAPEGFHDDYAMAWVLAQECAGVGAVSMVQGHHNLWATPALPAILPQMALQGKGFLPVSERDALAQWRRRGRR